MNLGIIVDSSTGLSKKEAQKLNFHYLPLIIRINQKEYYDGVNIMPQEYYEKIKFSDDVETSSTPPKLIIQELEDVSKKYDYTIVYPISGKLSSQMQNIKIFNKKNKNVYVVDSENVGYSIIEDCKKIKKFSETEDDIEKVLNYANNLSKKTFGITIPENLKWLVKGGRASKNIALMANMLKIIPIISIEHGKLEKIGKNRTFSKTVIKGLQIMKKKCDKNVLWNLMIAQKKPWNMEIINKIKENLKNNKIKITYLPPIIANHIGINSIGLIAKK